MSSARRGYLYGVGAYLVWGLFPLYWRLLHRASALEVLAHRIVWSFVAIGVVVTVGRGWGRIVAVVRHPRRLGLICLASVLIAINWGVYIYGVNANRVVETSLGYFINPLVTVGLGVLFLAERMRTAQWCAIGIGVGAVGVLTWDYGHIPYLALTLAGSFALYGLVKKRLGLPARDGLMVESAILIVPAIALVTMTAETARFGATTAETVLLILGGVVTSVPLLLFAGGANRIPLSSMGLLQYMTPVLQLGCGVLIFHEPMPPARLVGFSLVWLALIVFTLDGIGYARRANQPQAPQTIDPKALTVPST